MFKKKVAVHFTQFACFLYFVPKYSVTFSSTYGNLAFKSDTYEDIRKFAIGVDIELFPKYRLFCDLKKKKIENDIFYVNVLFNHVIC